jgi:hypothetical protein
MDASGMGASISKGVWTSRNPCSARKDLIDFIILSLIDNILCLEMISPALWILLL